MKHQMGNEKIVQNVERLKGFLFHTLGCSKKDAKRVIDKFIKRYLNADSTK